MSLHHEVAFEREICEHLSANGWIYEEGSAETYDRQLALYPPDLIAWVQEAHPEAWEVLLKNHGSKASATLLDRVRQQLDQLGTLDLLRHGVEVLGLPKALKLAEFKPAFGLNPAILARYNGQPAAGGAAGSLFNAQRELPRSGAVSQWHPGGHL